MTDIESQAVKLFREAIPYISDVGLLRRIQRWIDLRTRMPEKLEKKK